MLNKKICCHCSDEYFFFGWKKCNVNLWKEGAILCPALIRKLGEEDEPESFLISVSGEPPAECPFSLEQKLAKE